MHKCPACAHPVRIDRIRFAAPSRGPSVPARTTACETPSHIARCASRSPDRRSPGDCSSLIDLQRIQIDTTILRPESPAGSRDTGPDRRPNGTSRPGSASEENRFPRDDRKAAVRLRPAPARSSRRTPAGFPSRSQCHTTPTNPCSGGPRSARRFGRTSRLDRD